MYLFIRIDSLSVFLYDEQSIHQNVAYGYGKDAIYIYIVVSQLVICLWSGWMKFSNEHNVVSFDVIAYFEVSWLKS